MRRGQSPLAVLVLAAWLLGPASSVSAEVERLCLVSYERTSDEFAFNRFSKPYKMSVDFAKGSELNAATRSFKYNAMASYVLLWFKKGQVAIVKLDNILLTSSFVDPFSRRDFRQLFDFAFSGVTGHDQRGRTWKIECKQFGQYLDRRENRNPY